MVLVNIQEAKTHLSRLVERAAKGEEVVIAEAGEPKARLIAYGEAKEARKLGLLRGKIAMSRDWDSDEVNEEIARLFADERA